MTLRERQLFFAFLWAILLLGCAGSETKPKVAVLEVRKPLLAEEDCIPPAEVQEALAARKFGFQDCYQEELLKDPSLSGTVTLEVTVEPSGQVAPIVVSRSDIESPRLVTCLSEVCSGLSFTQSSCRSRQTVEYPIRLARGSSEFALKSGGSD